MNRWALAIILAYVAAFGVPKSPSPVVPLPSISTPSTAMRAAVEPVGAALQKATTADRALFADVWVKAGRIFDGDASGSPVIQDMRQLREYARIAATVGWNRLGQHAPGKYPDIDKACDAAFTAVLGLDTKALDSAGQQDFSRLCQALAWAASQR